MEEITEEAAELVARVAGLDIGKASLVCCVRTPHQASPGRRRQQVRTFATTTGQLRELRDWLAAEGVTRCVMEATSVYWKPPFYLLEDAIAECWLVNAREVKNVPGRPKTDLLTELPTGSCGGCGRRPGRLARFARCDQRRGRAQGLVAAGGAAAGLAGGDRGSIRPVSAG